jgi:phytoene dehydrogenase-like protein
MRENPVSIFGTSIADLTTAAYLARAGLDVAMHQQLTLPGGYISAFGRKGLTFPAGLTSLGSNGVISPMLKEEKPF